MNYEIHLYKAEIEKLKAKINALMLKYCPEEMTEEQLIDIPIVPKRKKE